MHPFKVNNENKLLISKQKNGVNDNVLVFQLQAFI